MHILLSGLLGAAFATLFSLLYNHIAEQVKWRIDLAMSSIDWLDNIYTRLISLQIHKERKYTKKEPYLSDEEYRRISNEVRALLLSEKMKTQVVLIYGEGDKMQKINALQGELEKVATTLWTANENTWTESSKNILNSFDKVIDPIKATIMREFVVSARKTTMLKNLLRGIFPTFYNFFTEKQKKNGFITFQLRTFIQVTALSLALMSSIFLARGTLTLTMNDLIELSSPKWDSNLDVLKNLTINQADALVGCYLLIFSFILQSINLLWPIRIGDFGSDRRGVLGALVFSFILFLFADNISCELQKATFNKAVQIIKQKK